MISTDGHPDWSVATNAAYVQERANQNGKHRYVIHCRACRRSGQIWSSRSSMKRIYGKSAGPQRNSWPEVMDLWTIHMGIHHPNEPQPDWKIVGDINPDAEAVELAYF